MDPELVFQALQLGEALAKRLLGHAQVVDVVGAAAESLVTHFQDIQSALRTNDQSALDAIRVRMDAEADALALPPA